jgi:hypothetical protein
MVFDFTLPVYRLLLETLSNQGHVFFRLDDYLQNVPVNAVILRHDADARPGNSLVFAGIQSTMGIQGSYYFNVCTSDRDKNIIREIHFLGHEIGYHYDTLNTCGGNLEKAWDEFRKNLDAMRRIVPVKTITMHGSPLSGYDNRALWEKYDYRSLGITGEPYFDIDFSRVSYYTDTGRMWDGNAFNLRDKIGGKDGSDRFHSTFDLIKAANAGTLPVSILFTFHPQRWTDNPFLWSGELAAQTVKNAVKYFFVKLRKQG